MLIIGDLHTGIRGHNQIAQEIFHDYFGTFLKDIFAYVDKNKIKTIVLLGDVFDVRKNLNLWAAKWFIKNFRDECIFRGLQVYVIVGNHDIFFRESIAVNSPLLILGDHPDTFTIVDEPIERNIDGMDCLLVPWICKENESEVMGAIRRSKADYLFGHFEFDGFDMYKGQPAKSHRKHDELGKFKKIWSGHYHHRSMRDNVIYTGTPWEMTWQDCNDPKGIYDFKDDVFEWIPNPHTMYHKMTYDQGSTYSESTIKGKYVKIQVLQRPDKKEFNKFMDLIYSFNPVEVKVEESYNEELASEVVVDKMKSTIQILHDYVDASDLELDKNKMKQVLNELYNAAMVEE